MQILIATDGTLDPEQAAEAVARWYREGDEVHVYTAVNIPVEFLSRLVESGVEQASDIALAAGHQLGAGDRAAERLASKQPGQAGKRAAVSDTPVMAALRETAHKRTGPIVAALQRREIPAKPSWLTTEGKTAHSIMAAARQHNAELIVIGSHGYGRFEGLLGSTGTKLVRHAPGNVLVLRKPKPVPQP